MPITLQSAWRIKLHSSELAITALREEDAGVVALTVVQDWGHIRRRLDLELDSEQILGLAKFLADIVADDEATEPGLRRRRLPPPSNGGGE